MEDEAQKIRAGQKEWEKTTLAEWLAQAPERKPEPVTQSLKWPVKRLYTPLDLEEVGFDYLKDAGFPGESPYTRGTEATMYRSNLWTMVQTTGFGSGEDANKRWRYLLDQGLSGFIIEYDLPTTHGLDSDHPLAEGEVSRMGVAIDSLADMEKALDLPFEKIKHMTSVCNAPQPVNLAMIIATLENKGIPPESVNLMIVNGILIEFICVGRYIFPPEPSLRIATDVLEYSIRNYPNWTPVSIIGAQLYAARATPIQEMAFSFSIAMAYLDSILERGLDIDTVAPYFSFVTGVDMDFFESIAKLRAYRKIWARLMQERYGARDPHSMRLKLMGSPGTMSLTLQQPLNNIARLGIQMLACVLGGGGQQMNIPLHDEAHALPSEEAVSVGAAIQHIVAHETGAADTVDPLAGSYYLESLTKKMENAVFDEIEKIDKLGGAVKAIEEGYFQKELAEKAFEYQKAIEEGRRKLVGVNILTKEAEDAPEIFQIDPEVEKKQIESLHRLKRERDSERVAETLSMVKEAAQGDGNLVPPIIEAVKAYATEGEICDVLRDVFGEYKPEMAMI
ncbi:MAG: methylmalonyl-CoA mutase [Deltaproteobacteria bacterium]|nr:methylmalonyl-CoA mutase [Deltaproteobacteria bacterium]